MAQLPESVADFLRGRRFAVAGVSRGPGRAANAIYVKLRDSGYETFPVNPNASQVEGATCYPNLASIPCDLDGVVVATHPSVSASIVREAVERGVRRVWLHRSFQGSVSAEAIQEAKKAGITCIVGGCPLMYCQPVDPGHAWLCRVLGWFGRLPR
jgi:predicted CoA-binding protein